ncbi:MAG: transposase [Myxococcota bacterium]
MFKPTDRQGSLFSGSQVMDARGRRRLERSWCYGFQQRVLPVLLAVEEEFADLYSDEVGRPNWSVARMLGVLLLAEMLDLDDQAALDSLTFDLRWQHALELGLDDAYLSRRSLVEFRGRLVRRDPEMARIRMVFDRVGEAALAELGLSISDQRLDSTRITSNIRCGGRVTLFRATLEAFGRWLGQAWPEKFAALSEPLRAWLGAERNGWFGAGTKEERQRKLQELAGWLVEVEAQFAGDEQVREEEPYLLLVRLLDEHCERVRPARPGDGDSGGAADSDGTTDSASAADSDGTTDSASAADSDGTTDSASAADSDGPAEAAPETTPPPVKVLKRPAVLGASLQSPHDPDAGYGHKGSGYHVQITETCNSVTADGAVPANIITDFDVAAAHVSDLKQLAGVLERLQERGRAPNRLFADGGYASGEALLHAQSLAVELLAPMTRPRMAADTLGREAFQLRPDGTVIACPAGHAPTRHDARSSRIETAPTLYAYFDGDTCRACPLLDRCAARPPNNNKKGSYHLEMLDRLIARDQAHGRQQTKQWRTDYRIRSGIEGTNSELKRAHGLGELRVRRMPRVRLAVSCKLTACNIKRWLKAIAETALKAGISPIQAIWRALAALTLLAAWPGTTAAVAHESPSLRS